MVQTIKNITDILKEAPYIQGTFAEALEIAKNCLQGELTLYVKENGKLYRFASTLLDEDESRCLDRLAAELPEQEEIFDLHECREAVADAVSIPIAYGETSGILIFEKYEGKINDISEENILIFELLGICLTAYMQHRNNRKNFYIDPLTELPGQVYFLLRMEKQRLMGQSQWILLTRIVDYVEQLQLIGKKRWDQRILEVKEILCSSSMTYSIGIDTFATILSGNKTDAYDQVIQLKDKLRSEYDMKMLLLDALLYEDLLAAIEKEFPNCRQGNVLVPSYGEPNIFDFFKEKTRKTGKGHSKSSIVLKDEDIDLFEFL